MGEDGVQGTLERLKLLVEERGECFLFCLVKSETGLEIISNVHDYVIVRGMLKVAEETAIDNQHVVQQMYLAETKREAEAAVAVMSGFKKPVSGVN